MNIDTRCIVSEAEANRDFSKVARIADVSGQAVIDVESTPLFDMSDDEKIDVVAARVLKRYRIAFEELAK